MIQMAANSVEICDFFYKSPTERLSVPDLIKE